jgi:hypothetical protein
MFQSLSLFRAALEKIEKNILLKGVPGGRIGTIWVRTSSDYRFSTPGTTLPDIFTLLVLGGMTWRPLSGPDFSPNFICLAGS